MNIGSIGESDALWVRPRKAEAMLACGHTRLYQLIGAGELVTAKDGGATKILVQSIYAYIERQVAKSRAAA